MEHKERLAIKFNGFFLIYSSLLGLLVGAVAALFLSGVHELIHLVWTTIPGAINFAGYPIVVGLLGGVLVGLFQKFVGDYPKTLNQTLTEFKTTGTVNYNGRVRKNLGGSLLVLTFGASLGPEAALSGIIGGMISWVGDHMKWTLAKKNELLELGLGAMVVAVFRAPFMGLGTAVETTAKQPAKKRNWPKTILYAMTTAFGLLGFALVKKLFPKSGVLAFHLPTIHWDVRAILVLPAAIILGIGFGLLFMWLDKLSELLAAKIKNIFVKTILAGLAIGILGLISYDFLFSGESQILTLSKTAMNRSIGALLILALGKTFLTNICFAFGWRGGKIFPAIFASMAVGFALAIIFPYMPGLIVSVVVATSVTVILRQAIVTATLLAFLFPLQFFPVILVVCLGIGKFFQRKK